MPKFKTKSDNFVIDSFVIKRGKTRDLRLPLSQSFTGTDIEIPLRVIRAKKPGPTIFITGAVHGDEINGTGIIREFLFREPIALLRGMLICVPVVNVFGFETLARYMPDGRDLNRCFPGSANGSLASRFANTLMEEIIDKCDFGIDLHSAAATRTNYPNVRADLRNKEILALAKAFGCELLVNNKGPIGSLRRAATDGGCPTLLLEAGEVNKIEPGIMSVGRRGIRNVLTHLDMLAGEVTQPAFQTRVKKSIWVRAALGGLLQFHVSPGDLVDGGQPLATTESIFGEAQSVIIAPQDGIVLGMATHPAARPGEPICHLAIPSRGLKSIRRAMKSAAKDRPLREVRDHLATNLAVSDAEGDHQWSGRSQANPIR